MHMILPFLMLLNFLICVPLGAKEQLLSSKDVRPMLTKLFELHIEKSEMDEELVHRSWKVYIKNFDATCAYLLEEEVTPYTQPNPKALSYAISLYKKDRYTSYFSLNQTIENGIYRARSWRAQWANNPQDLVKTAQSFSRKKELDKEFTNSLDELKKRHYHRVLGLISYLINELNIKTGEGNDEKLVRLCERQISSMENQYLGLSEIGQPISEREKEHRVVLRALKSIAYAMDAHTAFFSPDEAYAMKVQLEKGMCGIGVVLREGIDGVMIHEMIEGGPAEKSNSLRIGDTIVEVNGEPVTDVSFHHVLEVMRGKEGSPLRLGLLREGRVFHVELVRAKIALADKRVDCSSVPYGDGHIGRLTLHSFYEGEGMSSESDLKKALGELYEKGPLHGLVLDLRENSGGFLTQAVKVCNLFISSGVVVISKYSDGSIRYFRALDGQKAYEGPLVVLISKGSASAAEIVAQALQDYGVAIVVGDEQTYGKGTIQHQTITSSRTPALFKVTVGRYYTVSGRTTQIEGVRSDIVVPSAICYEEIGERYLDYPVSADRVPEAYQDSLSDVDPFAKRWFQKYYIPNLQQKESSWDPHLELLKTNSEARQTASRNYQNFLKKVKTHGEASAECGEDDLQLEEAVNILRDMIYLKNEAAWTAIEAA